MDKYKSPEWTNWKGPQWIIERLRNDRFAGNRYAHVVRSRALVASLLAAPSYAVFAVVNFGVYGSVSMAATSASAAILAVSALLLLRFTTHASLAGHCFTLSLATQVFGEMGFNGGLQAPAAALSLLIVPASIVTAGVSAVKPWAIITTVALATICVMDVKGLLPANELPLAAQQFDRMFSLVAGIIICSMLIILFERQTAGAIAKLSQERTDFRHRALHDGLTRMPNRSYFYEYAEASIEAAKLDLSSRIIFYFDIDHFKQINDHYGHAAGDALLITFASRLDARARPCDQAARLAGDEFAMIAEAPNEEASVDHLLSRLRSITRDPFELENNKLHFGVSIGYACFPDDGDDLETLLRVADSRMYADKTQRREPGTLAQADNVIAMPKPAVHSSADNTQRR